MITADRIVFHDDRTAWVVCHDNEHNDAAFRWDLLDRPCGSSCGGEGDLVCADGVSLRPCPDCIDGRHTFTIGIECNCWAGDDTHINSGPLTSCSACNNTGGCLLRVSVVPGMILPITTGPDALAPSYPALVQLRADGTALFWPEEVPIGDEPTLLDPFPSAAEPGMWAIQLAVSKQVMTKDDAEAYADAHGFYFLATETGWEMFADPPVWASWYDLQPPTAATPATAAERTEP